VKVPIDGYSVLDTEAPDLAAYEARLGGVVRWLVWCKHCAVWHRHGPAEGHREAHCVDPRSPYWKSGYHLAFAGEWRDRAKDDSEPLVGD
jgi:hypothetical protein